MATVSSRPKWALAVHGGAGAISREFDPERLEYMRDLRVALEAGAAVLRAGGSALDATVAAVTALEEAPLYNAGRGSVLTAQGTHELDAGVMRSSDMQSGAVTGVRTVRNPVQLAAKVLTHSPHVLLMGDGAEAFATLHNVERVENSYFTTPARLAVHHNLLKQAEEMRLKHLAASSIGTPTFDGTAPTSTPNPPFMMAPVLDHSMEVKPTEPSSSPAPGHPSLGDKKYGTVGAVALDMSGELATAVSTGGMSMKQFGRIGDSPVIGAGFYATKQVAVCCTGNGEAFLRSGVAKDVACLMEYKGLSVSEAANAAIANGERLCGKEDFEGGLIAIDAEGRVAMPYNSLGMYRGSITETHEAQVAVWETNSPPLTHQQTQASAQ